jgi:malonate transporter
LFLTLATGRLSGLELETVAMVSLLAMFGHDGAAPVDLPAGRMRGLSRTPAIRRMFQTSSRWNAFIALAIAEKMSGPEGLALVALVMAVIVIPLNLINVAMLVWFGTGARSMSIAGSGG